MSDELQRIMAIDDPYRLLREVTTRLADAQQEVTELARLRRRVVQDLHAQGLSYAQIAEKAGLSRGRIHQIRHTGPAPEGAFLGRGSVVVATPLRRDDERGRTVVAMDDVSSGKRLEDLARTYGLDVTSEHVSVGGEIDLNRDGLVVVCGPRMSQEMWDTYAQDPVLSWERAEDGPWTVVDRRTGTVYRSGQDGDPSRPYDVGYLGRLPRPDGNGSLLAIAGIHTQGSLGVVQLLANDLNTLWGQIGDRRFSTLVGVEYDPETSEPQSAELLCPLYRHDEEATG
ncbi:sigma factor-like helix-turn-helix DNA-binding protein [Streptomyces europaeiscabiei]|uniref:sigma factor-like helix-turn-helix DNA-binding protein n=1 Tax=Streptomyces europaeiscabiei TaxID=146819 RepID=UPI0029BF3DD6|nr:sigma factor-like helix-turn-helix DNA-binding protein [Streptomyces europaeiscabiei]MDX3581940.1 sigma factor-like helix-turn-helix DNA-binding protein [Streptomyces europaeiscabiei]WSG22507.1 sigma-70 family RNA polymerase sigma factor [Streptomyces europaeiscabiei]